MNQVALAIKFAVTDQRIDFALRQPETGVRVPRISRLMALGVRLEGLVRQGQVKDYAELARLGGISRARVTQILNLRNLAPTIQERLLFLEGEAGGLHERALRRVAQSVDWEEQQRQFAALVKACE